ncbi:MAG: hypothetical protein ACLGHN_03705 [Bacteriovoracia bacterium]
MRVFIILLVSTLTLSGCGDLLGTKVVKRDIGSSIAELKCELDLDRFSDIMHENISSEIRCLGESLNLFIRIVKSGKPGYLSYQQLERYLATRPDIKPEILKALKSVFLLGHLITGEDPNYVSKETVDKVVQFALVFNQEAALNFGPIFQNESPVTYALHQNHRDRVSSANKAIVQALRTIYNPNRNGETHKLNIIELLESFSTEISRPAIERAKKILFLKKVLFGGENEVITHNELEKVILNFDQLLLIGLDIVRYKYIILKQESILQLLKRDVNDLFDIITQGTLNNRDYEKLFTMDEAYEAAKMFIDEDTFKVDDFRNIISEVKVIAMKGNKTEVKGGELKNLFYHAKSLLQTGTVFHRIYDKFKVQLESPRPVEETIDFDEYRHTYPEHQAELDQFERITKKYRFMKGEFFSSYYVRGYRRNADAIFEIALMEYGLKLLFTHFGSPSPNGDAVGGYSLDQWQMQKLIVKFEEELIKIGLLTPHKALSTADNISLLGTLFQYQSDKNGMLDVNEGTEFGVSLLSSLNIADDIHTYMKEANCTIDEFDRTDPACFKANFFVGLCKYYRNNFPLMFDSFQAPKDCGADEVRNSPEEIPSWVTRDMQNFLNRSTEAARTCNYYTDGNKEEIPYSEGDIVTIMLAIMHAETTVLRWDVNANNILDAAEIDRSYEIYSPALDGFLLEKNPLIKKLKKQIFQYLVKYEEVPDETNFKSVWKFVKFLLSFNKKADGNRKTIVSILDVIGDENAKTSTGPKYDCNWLRDPDNIPREIPVYEKPLRNAGSDINVNEALRTLVSLINSYSPAATEELKRQLNALSDDMIAGNVDSIRRIRQPLLKELFKAISKNKYIMREIRAVVSEGSEIERIALAVSAVLLEQE